MNVHFTQDAHQLEPGALVVMCPPCGLIVPLTWIVTGALAPCRELEPWLLSTLDIITPSTALTGQVITEVPELGLVRCMGREYTAQRVGTRD